MSQNKLLFEDLLNCVKYFEKKIVEFPDAGKQKKYQLYRRKNKKEKFTLFINRKGHLNLDNLTYQMMSKTLGVMVRLDWNGAPHDNIATPHIHIFDEEHNYGKIAVPVEEIDMDLATELQDSLVYLLDYTRVDYKDTMIVIL